MDDTDSKNEKNENKAIFLNRLSKVIHWNSVGFALLHSAINFQTNKSKTQTNPDSLRLIRVFPPFVSALVSDFYWFTGLSASLVIGPNHY